MKRKILLSFFLSGIITGSLSSQSISPQVVNTTGGTYSFGYTIIDWNVGEMALVNTIQSPNLQVLVTNGLLQPFVDNFDVNTSSTFGPEEIRVFPNPATTYVEIDFLTKQKGRIRFKLYDGLGQMMVQREFYSYGYGRIERINMDRWASSEYYLHIVLEPETGSVGKTGSYKIIKLR